MTATFSAPGKAVILGEYAVLEGAPALTTAVDRRASVRVSALDAPEVHVYAPDLGVERAVIELSRDGWRWKQAADAQRLPLVHQVLMALLPSRHADARGFELRLDTAAFVSDSGHKLGLGSSAALTVACASAVASQLNGREPDPHSEPWLRECLNIHRAFQNGQGSGVDVATALQGRCVLFQRRADRASTQPLRWPQGLHARFIWSGLSTSTPRMLDHYATWKLAAPAVHARHLHALALLAKGGTRAFAESRIDEFLHAVEAYADALSAMDADSGLGIVSTEHAQMRRVARDAGLTYKPCGAGGGDIGVALSKDRARLHDFDAAITQGGFVPLALTPDAPGLLSERFNLEAAA